MSHSITYLPYKETGYFSQLVNDYLDEHLHIQPFFTYAPTADGLHDAIEARNKFPVDRKTLTEILAKQYENLPKYDKASKNIALLAQKNTFTVCTAHQPNLLTGYLYFVYKILHAIKLAEDLNHTYPDKHFVPVYYMGSEDNDLAELGTFKYNGDKYVWDGNGQTGAVGRMNTGSLKPLLSELFKLFGPPGVDCDLLKEILTEAYIKHGTIGSATQYLVNELFGRYGLVVLDPDEAGFKAAILPMMQDDLLHHTAYSIVSAQIEKLSVHYKAQAHPRPINLFYLNEQLRERIERRDDTWYVLNTNIQWDEAGLLKELQEHPERFSPNVILRGMFQETILPDVAFIGGGAEVAYWLQLKTVFEHYNVFYPSIHLRQSALWINPLQARLRKQLKLSISDIFKPEVDLIKEYISRHSGNEWQTDEEVKAVENILLHAKEKATKLDPTLRASAEAAITKIKYQLQILEKKMLRAEKRKMQEQILKITRLESALFPNHGLQERVDNFTDYFLQYGFSFFDVLKDAMEPLKNEFLIIEDNG